MNKIRHFGVYVNNIKKTEALYKKFGLKTIYKKMEDWGDVFGKINVLKMISINGVVIEFVEKNGAKCNGSHVCFEVKDLNSFYKKNVKKFIFLCKPRMSPDKSVKILFLKDFNGIMIELVEIKED